MVCQLRAIFYFFWISHASPVPRLRRISLEIFEQKTHSCRALQARFNLADWLILAQNYSNAILLGCWEVLTSQVSQDPNPKLHPRKHCWNVSLHPFSSLWYRRWWVPCRWCCSLSCFREPPGQHLDDSVPVVCKVPYWNTFFQLPWSNLYSVPWENFPIWRPFEHCQKCKLRREFLSVCDCWHFGASPFHTF